MSFAGFDTFISIWTNIDSGRKKCNLIRIDRGEYFHVNTPCYVAYDIQRNLIDESIHPVKTGFPRDTNSEKDYYYGSLYPLIEQRIGLTPTGVVVNNTSETSVNNLRLLCPTTSNCEGFQVFDAVTNPTSVGVRTSIFPFSSSLLQPSSADLQQFELQRQSVVSAFGQDTPSYFQEAIVQ